MNKSVKHKKWNDCLLIDLRLSSGLVAEHWSHLYRLGSVWSCEMCSLVKHRHLLKV